MKIKRIAILLFVGIISLFTLFLFLDIKDEPIKIELSNKIEDFQQLTIENKVNNLMNEMTIEEKIGQMLIIYDTHETVDEELKQFIKDIKPSGFIINQSNITTFAKTKKYIEDLKLNSKIPLIISIDQEGGKVQRLQNLEDKKATYIPDMFDLGKTNDINLAYEVGKVLAEDMRTLGINVTYAPVCDVYSNPNNKVIGERSFGTDPNLVANMCVSLGKGLEDNGIIATYKHFPGHGDTTTDSHTSLPIINKSYEELLNNELIPFKKAIENDAKIIMIGHIAFPDLTNDNTPASLSKKIITDLLKNDLGYDGLVITDALNMGALINNYSDEDIYVKAVEAGVDILLMPTDAKKAIEVIKDNISVERIDESVKKILIFKYTYLKDNILDESYLNNKEHQEIISKIPIEQ